MNVAFKSLFFFIPVPQFVFECHVAAVLPSFVFSY